MYCKHCGAEIEEGCKYCRFCGMSVVTLEKMTGDEHIDAIPDAEAEKAMRKRKAGTRAVAILGTFGAVFAAPCAIAGFVMALIALIIAGRQKRKYGSVATAAKVGRVFAVIGLILSVISAVVTAFFIFVVVPVALLGGWSFIATAFVIIVTVIFAFISA